MDSNETPQPLWQEKHRRFAIDGVGVALRAWHVDAGELLLDPRAYKIWGVPGTTTVTFEDLSRYIHPSDRDRNRAAFDAARAVIGPYEIDFRILAQVDVRWISARGKGDDEGMAERSTFGIFLDVSGRKQAEESNARLAGEMDHRVKNLLAIACGLTSITSRSSGSTEDLARQLTNRPVALGRAHDLVRPLPGYANTGALLGDLRSVLVAPYDDLGPFSGRIRISVPRMAVWEAATTTLALVIHELAANSLKYGALSCDAGTLDVASTDPMTRSRGVWTERGAPPVTAQTGDSGYGSKLTDRATASQLGCTLTCDWDPEGLVAKRVMKRHRLGG